MQGEEGEFRCRGGHGGNGDMKEVSLLRPPPTSFTSASPALQILTG